MNTLAEILDLEQIDARVFRGRSRKTDVARVFGGEVAGQALVAAGRTVPDDRRVHSLHSYFLRPGDPGASILYQVDAIRDGRSFTTRRVVATQHGEAIFHLSASFHIDEKGVSHQVPQLVAPAPEHLPTAEESLAHADQRTHEWFARLRERLPVEYRFPEELPRLASTRGELGPPHQRVWLRSAQPLSDDPLVHVCAATYASDMFLLSSALPPHGAVIDHPGMQVASLDHAVWFHARFRADDWLLYEQEGTWAGGARALCRGSLFDRNGTLVASVVQEGLIRQ
ncbi:MAG: acyl-CoA thioesterase [Mycobacteriales bacterium]